MSAASTSPSLSIHITNYLKPDDVPAFLEALRPVYEAIIKERENIFFELYVDPENPGVVKWVENWNATTEWLTTVQMQKEYYKPSKIATDKMHLKPPKIEIWTRMPHNEWVHFDREFYKTA